MEEVDKLTVVKKRVSTDGHVVLPAYVRDRLGIEKGDELTIEILSITKEDKE